MRLSFRPMGHYSTRKVHFAIAALVLLLDRASKFTVEHSIMLHDSRDVLAGFFRLTHVQNPGATDQALSVAN